MSKKNPGYRPRRIAKSTTGVRVCRESTLFQRYYRERTKAARRFAWILRIGDFGRGWWSGR